MTIKQIINALKAELPGLVINRTDHEIKLTGPYSSAVVRVFEDTGDCYLLLDDQTYRFDMTDVSLGLLLAKLSELWPLPREILKLYWEHLIQTLDNRYSLVTDQWTPIAFKPSVRRSGIATSFYVLHPRTHHDLAIEVELYYYDHLRMDLTLVNDLSLPGRSIRFHIDNRVSTIYQNLGQIVFGQVSKLKCDVADPASFDLLAAELQRILVLRDKIQIESMMQISQAEALAWVTRSEHERI